VEKFCIMVGVLGETYETAYMQHPVITCMHSPILVLTFFVRLINQNCTFINFYAIWKE